jgi:hypothetical protein
VAARNAADASDLRFSPEGPDLLAVVVVRGRIYAGRNRDHTEEDKSRSGKSGCLEDRDLQNQKPDQSGERGEAPTPSTFQAASSDRLTAIGVRLLARYGARAITMLL